MTKKLAWTVVAITLLVIISTWVIFKGTSGNEKGEAEQKIRPALSVKAIHPEYRDIPLSLTAHGSIAAWQDAIIGAEIGDLRLQKILVDVGDNVRKGQVIAEFAVEAVNAEVAEVQASIAEAEANLAEAQQNADRARHVAASRAFSAQQITQYLTAEKTALAKLNSMRAQLQTRLLRKKHAQVIASDDGVISSRNATLGAVTAPGQELFRLIRQHRLEWRAELTAPQMAGLTAGTTVVLQMPGFPPIEGKVRMLAPTLDPVNRKGLVYVDLPKAYATGIRPGMFAQGQFNLGSNTGMTVPEAAVSLRDGFSYIFRLGAMDGDQGKVSQQKVQLGRRLGDRLEIISKLSVDDRLVAEGVAFLSDGDTVKVVSE